MDYIIHFFQNRVLQTAALSWFVAQVIKIILTLIKERKFDFTRLFGSGGMPSSHASFTVSLAIAIGYETSFSSIEFAIAMAFSLVVMYDATGIRQSAGEQAAILNRIVETIGKENFSDTGKKLKELLGHTPFQVFAGAILGFVIAFFRHFYF